MSSQLSLPAFFNSLRDVNFITVHIAILFPMFCLVLPLGSVLGHTRHKLHVSMQVCATCIALVGFWIAFYHRLPWQAAPQHSHHHHHHSEVSQGVLHVRLAPWLLGLLLAQVFVGFWRRISKRRGWIGRWKRVGGWRNWFFSLIPEYMHQIVGKSWMFIGILQVILGILKLVKPCQVEGFTSTMETKCEVELTLSKFI